MLEDDPEAYYQLLPTFWPGPEWSKGLFLGRALGQYYSLLFSYTPTIAKFPKI